MAIPTVGPNNSAIAVRVSSGIGGSNNVDATVALTRQPRCSAAATRQRPSRSISYRRCRPARPATPLQFVGAESTRSNQGQVTCGQHPTTDAADDQRRCDQRQSR